MPTTYIAVLYTLFAAISIVANLGLQKLSLLAYRGPLCLPLSVVIGTGGGLVLKFLLDKKWIFRYRHRDLAHGMQSLLLYSLMGVVTTLVFWGFEFGAWGLFHTEFARFAGGAFGLMLGYFVKYRLDRRFVFA
nr:GtrA family protein [Paraburkholderia sp.]